MQPILIRGGGDLASGVAIRLYRAGLRVAIAELPEPLAVRRTVSFAEAIYEVSTRVEDAVGRRVDRSGVAGAIEAGEIPVFIDPSADVLRETVFAAVVDARMMKAAPAGPHRAGVFLVGLGPGFTAGENCDAAVETRRGHTMGRVYWSGPTQRDSGVPEGDPKRVLRAPVAGTFLSSALIGAHVAEGEVVATIRPTRGTEPAHEIVSPMPGIVRGLLRSGLRVEKGMKIGDIDTRDDPNLCRLVSDKALAIGGGVLEALMAMEHGRPR